MPDAGWREECGGEREREAHKETTGCGVATELRASRTMVRCGRASLLMLAASCGMLLGPADAFMPAAAGAGRRPVYEAAASAAAHSAVAGTCSSSMDMPASRVGQGLPMHRRSFGGDRDVLSRLRGTLTMTRSDSPTRTDVPVWGRLLPAAVEPRRPPLQRLTDAEKQRLLSGERIQKQTRTGRVGSGIVVVDVEAEVATVLAVLSDVDRYGDRIPTVRDVQVRRRGVAAIAAMFCLSRFRLEINAEMRYVKDRNMIEFRLDQNHKTLALQEARGFWFVEEAEGRPKGWSRVWLKADVKCDGLLPPFIVDYAASRSLPRASDWLQPVMSGIQRQIGGGSVSVHDMHTDGEVHRENDPALDPPKWHPSQNNKG